MNFNIYCAIRRFLQCTWCPSLNRCSTGTDRKRQQWIQSGCERLQLKESKTCPALGTKGNNYSSQQTVTTAPSSATRENDQQNSSNAATVDANGNKTSTDVKKAAPHISSSNNNEPKHSHASFALGILLPIIVVASLVMWVFYAYRNPHTKSGQLLIQVRDNFFLRNSLCSATTTTLQVNLNEYLSDVIS